MCALWDRVHLPLRLLTRNYPTRFFCPISGLERTKKMGRYVAACFCPKTPLQKNNNNKENITLALLSRRMSLNKHIPMLSNHHVAHAQTPVGTEMPRIHRLNGTPAGNNGRRWTPSRYGQRSRMELYSWFADCFQWRMTITDASFGSC